MQSKRNSLIEAAGNTLSGFLLSYGLSFVIYPLLGMEGNAESYAAATAIFTVLSIGRNFFVRRGFTKYFNRGNT